jgi:DNA-binding beta-propeller fold protein YncE
MVHVGRAGLAFAGAVLLAAAGSGGAQSSMTPINDAPNPYKTIEGWARLPDGRAWGSTSAVAIGPDGKSVWVAERCGANACAGSPLPSVYRFDANGNTITSFGAGMILSPHGITVDPDGNVWVVDCSCTLGRNAPAANPPAGHQVFKFSPDGKLLLTLGKAGGAGSTAGDSGYFWQPNAILVAPNGTIFVAEGHSSSEGAVARIYKFSKDGKLVATWGQFGKGPDDYDQPHALAMDSKGRLFVGDRGNNRIKIFDQDGTLLDTWYQFSRPSGIYIDAHDTIYVADSESGSVARERTDWKRGIRVGSARDGTVTAFIPDPAQSPPSTSAAEGVAVDSRGVIYGAEVGPRALKRYVKQ